MIKQKRKLYRIKEMRQRGLSYIQRGLEINKMNMGVISTLLPEKILAKELVKEIKLKWWQKLWKWLLNKINPTKK